MVHGVGGAVVRCGLLACDDWVVGVMDVRVQLDQGAHLPERAHAWDAGADLRTPVPVAVYPHGSATVDTGVHVEIPEGYAGFLKSKSGLMVRDGITCEGVVDAGYTGSIVAKLHNHGKRPRFFDAGDKVVQLVIVPVLCCGFVEVDAIEGGERGDAGFGSTGAR